MHIVVGIDMHWFLIFQKSKLLVGFCQTAFVTFYFFKDTLMEGEIVCEAAFDTNVCWFHYDWQRNDLPMLCYMT